MNLKSSLITCGLALLTLAGGAEAKPAAARKVAAPVRTLARVEQTVDNQLAGVLRDPEFVVPRTTKLKFGAAPPTQKLPMLTWRNPQASDPGVLVRDGWPEGLTLVGPDGKPTTQLDPNKKTVIYVHGWSPGYSPKFQHPAEWNAAGWNTMLYLWHARAHRDMWQGLSLAEGGQIARELTEGMHRLRTTLDQGEIGTYTKEIRLVGYSLGAYSVVQAAHRVFYEEAPYANYDWQHHLPRRVDLLEPAFLDSFTQADQVAVNVGDHKEFVTPSQISRDTIRFPQELSGWGVKVVAFTSAVHRYVAPNLERSMFTQQLSDQWRPGDDVIAKPEDQHVEILDYYFGSIVPRQPKTTAGSEPAFSARTSMAELERHEQSTMVQVGGVDTLRASDDTYKEVKTEAARSGPSVDYNPTYTDNATLRGTIISLPLWQSGY